MVFFSGFQVIINHPLFINNDFLGGSLFLGGGTLACFEINQISTSNNNLKAFFKVLLGCDFLAARTPHFFGLTRISFFLMLLTDSTMVNHHV